MTRVRTDDIPIAVDEPFGMNGVLSWLKPLLSVCCCFAAIGCIMAGVVSETRLVGVRRDAPNVEMWLESLFGRLQLQVGDGDPLRHATADYVPTNLLLGRLTDRWEPSWKKTIGIEWGDAVRAIGGGRQMPVPVWQLRVRWRTLAVLFALPPIVSLINVLRRRRGHAADTSNT